MDEKTRELIKLIKDALENVGEEYYKITTTYKTLGIIRERVFCYELYHQMRLIQDKKKLYNIQIHGEIDKSGHVNFKGSYRNPDFVFHVPGSMEGNAIVVEVKGRLDNDGICKDFETLSKFTDKKHYYQLGVFIIYNYTIDDFWNMRGQDIKDTIFKYKCNTNKILIISKKNINIPSEIVTFDDLLGR